MKHAGGRPRIERARKDTLVAARLDDATVARLDALVSRSRGVLTRASVARAAMLFGLDALEKDPAKLFQDTREPISRDAAARGMRTKAKRK